MQRLSHEYQGNKLHPPYTRPNMRPDATIVLFAKCFVNTWHCRHALLRVQRYEDGSPKVGDIDVHGPLLALDSCNLFPVT